MSDYTMIDYSSHDRWLQHRAFAAEWHKPLVDGESIPEAKLQAAEKRLKLKLPAALRECICLPAAVEILCAVVDPVSAFAPPASFAA